MLPRGKRLSRASFAPISRGKRAVSAHFSVSVGKSMDGRAAVVVSKKVAKKAVDRNLLQRRVLEAVAPYVAPGHSFIVYARTGSPTLSYKALALELQDLFNQLLIKSKKV